MLIVGLTPFAVLFVLVTSNSQTQIVPTLIYNYGIQGTNQGEAGAMSAMFAGFLGMCSARVWILGYAAVVSCRRRELTHLCIRVLLSRECLFCSWPVDLGVASKSVDQRESRCEPHGVLGRLSRVELPTRIHGEQFRLIFRKQCV